MRSRVASANAPGCDFPVQNLPYGVFSRPGRAPCCGVAIGDMILDLAACEARGLVDAGGAFAQPRLNDFMAQGRVAWARMRARLSALLAEGGAGDLPLVAMADAALHLPLEVREFTDFYASKHHAQHLGQLFRGPENALPAQWTHMPIGYNGRASSVVVSGTPVRRPMGQVRGEAGPEWTASRRLDLELELGAVIGAGSTMGARVSVDQAEEMIFGYVLLNDWSARDIQAWEYQPLGPFQSKALATTISPWIVTQAALEPFRCPGAARDNPLLPYLTGTRPGFYDLTMGWTLNGQAMGLKTGIAALDGAFSGQSDLTATVQEQEGGTFNLTGLELKNPQLTLTGDLPYPDLKKRRGDGRAVLTLEGGLRAPVSRRYARALREADWW